MERKPKVCLSCGGREFDKIHYPSFAWRCSNCHLVYATYPMQKDVEYTESNESEAELKELGEFMGFNYGKEGRWTL